MSERLGLVYDHLLGGLLADKLQSALMRRLPIDVLAIDPGDGLRTAQLEAGT